MVSNPDGVEPDAGAAAESVLKGNYALPAVTRPAKTLEELTTEEFERRCRAVQSKGNGLAGSVPYVKKKPAIWTGPA